MPRLLDNFAAEMPDCRALSDERGSSTWAELHERTRRLINAFRARGLDRGDTLAVLLSNRREYFEVFLACAHAGVSYVPINWHWTADEVAYVIDDSGASGLLSEWRFADVAIGAVRSGDAGEVGTVWLVDDGDSPAFVWLMNDQEPGLYLDYETALRSASSEDLDISDQYFGGPMFYTSGTTGRPKGVRGALSGAGDVASELLELVAATMGNYVPERGCTLLTGPVYHSAQWVFSFLPMVRGSSVVMRDKFDAQETLRLLEDEKVTNVHLVPTQLKRLLDLPAEQRERLDHSALEAMWHGAAPCPPAWKHAMIDWLGPKVHEYYGSTEGTFISSIRADEWLQKPGSVGRPVPAMEARVVDERGQMLGPNCEGELYFRSRLGIDFVYHNAPDKTREAHLEPGLFSTGDIGWLDDDGYVWLADRKIDMIISGGVNIYPAEIEAALAEHPAVVDVAVFGVPNDEFGEEIKAVVELGSSPAPVSQVQSELGVLAAERLARYKQPRSIDFVDELPRNSTGKIMKRELRDPYWSAKGRRI